MNFIELKKIENETERVNRTYDIFNEGSRLNHSKAARVEFLTTVHYIEKYLREGDKILDIGAGAGEYSLYFARKGYKVSALELADANIAAFRKKLTPEDSRTDWTACADGRETADLFQQLAKKMIEQAGKETD